MILIEPVGPRLVVKPVPPENYSIKRAEASGLEIPTHLKEKYTLRPTIGLVVAVSVNYKGLDGTFFTKGDAVLFASHSGSAITLEGNDFIILEEREVLAKLIVQES